jgi:Na+/melibiose symporter-like transporter
MVSAMTAWITCPHCGEPNSARARFCSACGGRIVGVRPPLDPEPALADAQPFADTEAAPPEESAAAGPKLLWWTIPADSLLHNPSFRALMWMRVASETAINAIGYGMLVTVVQQTHSGFAAALVTVSTVAPAAIFGVVGGAVVDRTNKRLMLVLANVIRALICVGFLFTARDVVSIYALLWILTIASQFATPAESAIVPRVVHPERLAGANSFANLCEAAGQLLGMAILAPIFVAVTEDARPLVLVCGLIFIFAAVRALAIRTEVIPEEEVRPALAATGGRPWLAGTLASLSEAWSYLASNRPAFITAMLLVLASTANLVMVTLAPRFTQEILNINPSLSVFIFGPAVVGMLTGLALVPRITHIVRPRVLVLMGFLLMVTSLLAIGGATWLTDQMRSLNFLGLYDPGPFGWKPLNHSDGRLGTVMLLAIPLGFSFSVVQVAANTFLNQRVPLRMQGRVFALQGAVKNATAIIPLLVLGGLASLVGVGPVLIIAPFLILFLALYGASKSTQLAERRGQQGTGNAEVREGSGRGPGAEPA